MTIFTVIAIANTVTFGVTAVAALQRPVGSYIFIAAIALCACIASFYQAATGTGLFVANILTSISLGSIAWRIALNTRGVADE
jgi:hypothetical protein